MKHEGGSVAREACVPRPAWKRAVGGLRSALLASQTTWHVTIKKLVATLHFASITFVSIPYEAYQYRMN